MSWSLKIPILAQFCEAFFFFAQRPEEFCVFTVQNRKVHSFCRKITACCDVLHRPVFICLLWGSTAALTSCSFSPSCVCSGLCYCSNAQGTISSCSVNRLGTAALCLLAQKIGSRAASAVDWSVLVCYSQFFFLTKTLGVFSVPVCKLPGKDHLLLVKVWLLCTISGVPVLPICTCDWEHRDSIASSMVLQRIVSPSKVQTFLQNWALSSPLWLCPGYLWGWVSEISLCWFLCGCCLLFSFSPTPSLPFFFFFPSLLPCIWYLHSVLTQSSPQMLCNCFFLRV